MELKATFILVQNILKLMYNCKKKKCIFHNLSKDYLYICSGVEWSRSLSNTKVFPYLCLLRKKCHFPGRGDRSQMAKGHFYLSQGAWIKVISTCPTGTFLCQKITSIEGTWPLGGFPSVLLHSKSCYSEGGPWVFKVGITYESVRAVQSQVLPRSAQLYTFMKSPR